MKIVVDAMGGDYAPKNVVLGAIDALNETSNRFEIILVGDEHAVQEEIKAAGGADGLNMQLHHTSQVITMSDSAATAVKSKPDSSIVVGLGMCKKGAADAFLSAGNTGAVMAASTVILGRIPGVLRPTISALFPRHDGYSLILDVGANVDCKPEHLVQFSKMGSILMKSMLNIENPRVGLLNIGEEESKGNELTKETFAQLKASTLNFVGNVEGRDIFKGTADVFVCDGFVGNIILKFAETISHVLVAKFKDQIGANKLNEAETLLISGILKQTMKSFDYEEIGGVPLLGVNGVSIIGHGGSTPKAIKNMILESEKMVNLKVNHMIQTALN